MILNGYGGLFIGMDLDWSILRCDRGRLRGVFDVFLPLNFFYLTKFRKFCKF
jgi:hypothetical protein